MNEIKLKARRTEPEPSTASTRSNKVSTAKIANHWRRVCRNFNFRESQPEIWENQMKFETLQLASCYGHVASTDIRRQLCARALRTHSFVITHTPFVSSSPV